MAFNYISINWLYYGIGILSGGADDFDSSDDLYDAIGAILQEISREKSEDDIR